MVAADWAFIWNFITFNFPSSTSQAKAFSFILTFVFGLSPETVVTGIDGFGVGVAHVHRSRPHVPQTPRGNVCGRARSYNDTVLRGKTRVRFANSVYEELISGTSFSLIPWHGLSGLRSWQKMNLWSGQWRLIINCCRPRALATNESSLLRATTMAQRPALALAVSLAQAARTSRFWTVARSLAALSSSVMGWLPRWPTGVRYLVALALYRAASRSNPRTQNKAVPLRVSMQFSAAVS